jgi:hypothetical protein
MAKRTPGWTLYRIDKAGFATYWNERLQATIQLFPKGSAASTRPKPITLHQGHMHTGHANFEAAKRAARRYR